MRKLDLGTQHIVVGTPGRVFDMLQRKVLRTKSIKLFVLDEADEMLSRGFKDQIYDVFKLLPSDVQVILLSGINIFAQKKEKRNFFYSCLIFNKKSSSSIYFTYF